MRKKESLLRIILMFGLLFPALLQGQMFTDYAYTTGVDINKWITLPASATQVLTPNYGDDQASGLFNLGFTFPFSEDDYTQFSVNTNGNLRLGSIATSGGGYSSPFNSSNAGTNSPKINFFGCDGYVSSNHYVNYLYTTDANNDSVGVVEFCVGTYNTSTRNELYKWQVHLYPSGKIVVVFGPTPTTAPSSSRQQGMCADLTNGFVIDQNHLLVPFPSGYSTNVNSYWPTHGRYYQFVRPLHTCHRPLEVTVSNIGMGSFDVGWTDTSSVTQWRLVVSTESVTVSDQVVTSQPVTIAGLSPSTTYQVRVAGICGVDDTSTFRGRMVTTPCAAMTTIPYYYGFEDAATSYSTSTSFVTCWMRLNNAASYYYPYVGSGSSYNHTPSGYKGLYWYNYSSAGSSYGDYQCVVLPGIDTSLYPIRSLLLRFWAYTSSSSHPPVFQMGVMTDPNDITTFTTLRTVNVTTTGQWTEMEADYSSYTGTGIYMAVMARRTTGTWSAYLDDFSITLRPSCPQVAGVEVDHVAPTSAMASWDVRYLSDALTGYTVEVEEQGVGLVQTLTTTEQFVMLSALSPNTGYLVRVRANCTGTSTDWDTTTFATLCSDGEGQHITGNGTSRNTYYLPINNFYNYSYSQQLVLASELAGPATLQGIRFNYSSVNTVNTKSNCTIYVAHTSLSSLSSSNYVNPSTMTMVYTGPMNVTQGWNDFTFTTPFAYNGTSNLVVAVDDNSGNYSGSTYTYSAYNTNNSMALLYFSDSQNPDPASLGTFSGSVQTYYYRAEMEFIEPCDNTLTCFAPNLLLASTENDRAELVWAPGSGETSWDVDYRVSGGSWVNAATGVTVTHYTFTDLLPGTEYDFRVSSVCEGATYSDMVSHRTRCSYSTFSYDDLHAPYVQCYYGTYSVPDIMEGVVDYGYTSESSRHTVHYDITETDYNTRNQLHTVPEGYCSSVRLGNWSTGSQAERIVYTYTVDTTDSDLLLLKYAAVLEDPNHDATEQPRFTFRITDQQGNTVSPCYAADFIANANLGWNTGYSQVLWKDWTTVGVDLTSMQGQTIQIELTSYDCDQGGHYGYAYFVLDLSHKALRSNSCSGVENTFYAPQGFNYSWYEEGHENTVLSTVDSLSVSHEGIYHCQLSFVGAPLDEEHSNCYFTMSAVAGVRYPFARFSVLQLDTSACSQTWMRMLNNSIITSDSLHTDSIGNSCESYLWRFDDGTTSTDPNPRHGFTPGQHTVTLYAMLADGACSDSATQTFLVLSPCMEYDTVAVDICEGDTLRMFDTVLVEEGTHVLESTFANDSILIRTVYLTVNPRTYDTVSAAACVSYVWALDNQTYTATGFYNDTLLNHQMCDSVVTLDLRISPNYEEELYDTICQGGTLVFGSQTLTTTGRYTDSLLTLSAPHCDSVVFLNLTVHANTVGDTFVQACEAYDWHNRHYEASALDTLYGFMPNAMGCDSSLVLHLTINNMSVTHYYDTCTENQLPRTFRGHTLYGPTTSLSDTVLNSSGCDSVIIYHLCVLYNSHAAFDSTVCETELPMVWYHRTFTAAGTQADTLTNSVGADSLLQLTLHVVATDSIDIYQSICDNQSYLFEGTTYTAAGIYPHQFLSSQGCDSVRTLHLTLLLTTQGDTMATECDQFQWHGTTYTTDDTVTVPAYTTNLAGCDSAVTLYLRILPSYQIGVYDTICSNMSYLFEGTYYNVAGSYNVPLHTATLPQCDSIRTLYLAVRDTSVGDTFATACDQYQWYGRSYTLTTLDQLARHYTNAVGCDSAVNLHLTVNHSSQTQVYDTCVENALPRFFNGITIGGDTTGVQVVLADVHGCDSTVTYQLHVWHNEAVTIDSTICDDALASFQWHGVRSSLQPLPDNVAEKTVQHDTLHTLLPTTHGADSNVTLLLHVRPTYRMTVYDTICDGDSVLFGGQVVTNAGQYVHTFNTLLGCDSVVTLHLTVNPTYAFHFYDTIYYGDTVTFEGNIYSMPGDYDVHYATVEGCDSTLIMHLTGRNILQVERTDSICQGDTLYFMGRALTEAGVYVDTNFTGDFIAGDTIVTLNLVVLPPPTATVEEVFFCESPAHYQLQGHSDVPYLEWLGPAIAEGHEHDSIITVPNASDTIHYMLYVDYRPEPLCPLTVDVALAPIEELNALIDLRPTSLTIDERHLSARHVGGGRVERQLWYIFYNDESPFTDTSRLLSLDVPMYVDSLMLVLTIENDMCAATDTVHVDVLRADILFPNVFTPSRETNNYFRAFTTAVSDFELWIYDRRGDLVFHSTDIDEGWDGTSDGRPLPQATYVYKCHYRDQVTPNGWQSKTGTVTLLR